MNQWKVTAGLMVGLVLATAVGAQQLRQRQPLPPLTPIGQPPLPAAGEARLSAQPVGQFETVATFEGPMLTGVTVSRGGRIFVNFPRWGDPVEYTVAEVVGGRSVPYPNAEINRATVQNQAESLISVQSVVVDPKDRLWILDTGSIQFAPTTYGGPKLIGIDLKSNQIVKKILFPREVALPTSYLNDVRFDLRRGREGYAYITDSSDRGANAIVVVDLSTGKSWRRLNNHPSTKAEPNFVPVVEGRPLYQKPNPEQPAKNLKLGADGIAMGSDGKRLYYCPLASRRLYSVSVDALSDQKLADAAVAATVIDEGVKPASDGLESDTRGQLYATDYENNAVRRRLSDGTYETVVADPRILWPDTLSVAADGYLYITNNQLHRQPAYQEGKDLRQKPYSLLRVKIDAAPVALLK